MATLFIKHMALQDKREATGTSPNVLDFSVQKKAASIDLLPIYQQFAS
jgi:hypothetical protein